MPENFFEIENVSFTAGGKNKVNNVNLSIENEGDITVSYTHLTLPTSSWV